MLGDGTGIYNETGLRDFATHGAGMATVGGSARAQRAFFTAATARPTQKPRENSDHAAFPVFDLGQCSFGSIGFEMPSV
jgi:hypothetical protein